MILYGLSKDLQFVPSNRKAWLDFLENNNGKKLVLNIEREKAKRSLNQNSFYHAYLQIISNEIGHTSEELHRIFKGLFLPKRKIIFKGKEYFMLGSTTELNKVEFGEFLDRICSETGVPIPDPKLLADYITLK